MTSIADITWAAGIYEGEGHFNGHSVFIGQKNKWLCDKLQSMFNGSVNQQLSRAPDYYVWILSGKESRGFLLTIFTFLSPKRRKQILQHKEFFIDENFGRQDTCRNGHKYEKGSFRIVKDDRNSEGWVKNCLLCNPQRAELKERMALNLAKMKNISVEEAKKLLVN